MISTRAALLYGPGEDYKIETIELDEPGLSSRVGAMAAIWSSKRASAWPWPGQAEETMAEDEELTGAAGGEPPPSGCNGSAAADRWP
jgi:hypothetical protein